MPEGDVALREHVEALGVAVVEGSEHDVLGRVLRAARAHGATVVVRITGDCPFIDPDLVDEVVGALLSSRRHDYAANVNPPTFPDGLDVEAIRLSALERIAQSDDLTAADREHVTTRLRSTEFADRRLNVEAPVDWSSERWTLDTSEDLAVVRAAYTALDRDDFRWTDVLQLRCLEPDLFDANRHLASTGGSPTGQRMWERAKQVIPGGSMLLSKNADQTLPGEWPAYFSGAEGCVVRDLNGRSYLDFYYMGLGTNTLGYRAPEVERAVQLALARGNMSTLLAPEEVFLAERLVDMHPWSDMVRFTRSGGEAVAVAVRIARAASGRDGVIFCGYHGWHDWYLAANLRSGQALDEHLIPGLEPLGVPQVLAGTSMPFTINDVETFERLMADHDPGVIVMEVMRNTPPEPGFLEMVRDAATRQGAVLIFDECTSGFRETFGGLHLAMGVNPDLVVLGKALGNGYAVAAAVGTRAVMEHATRAFVSSTFWTERVGAAAGLATLAAMEQKRSWELLPTIGERVSRLVSDAAASQGVPLRISGLRALAFYDFGDGQHSAALRTVLSYAMLERGFLAGAAFYASLAHTDELLPLYGEAVNESMLTVRQCWEDPERIPGVLGYGIAGSGFGRLN